ncbi:MULTISPECIES: TIR domain-containing protein [Clostridiaceae]|uniref:Nucleotide-binding protein n=1 Tax=Clostridium facile TaxID=2763035 RepID=A0ABR7IPU4_9CLOT|nr:MULTISPECIES: TIR domain-containing protein [Clostridiaceae]MBC5787146.1 nucleotide-binding protein [Clostridium facile]
MNNKDKLEHLYQEIDELIEKNVTFQHPAFNAWHSKVLNFLSKQYGEFSSEYTQFHKRNFTPKSWDFSSASADCIEGLEQTKIEFENYLQKLGGTIAEKPAHVEPKQFSNKVFLLHGRNSQFKDVVIKLLEKQNIQPIMLTQGYTMMEQVQANQDIIASIVLFSEDDTGKPNEEKEFHSRAGQSVLFGAGYLTGKLGKDKTLLLSSGLLELPPDLQDIVNTNTGNWQLDVLKQLKKIGFSIDLNKLFE